jgi:type VI secretion system protein ImpK
MGESLRDVFSPIFAYILFAVRSPSTRRRSARMVKDDILRLLETQQALVKRYSIPPSDYDNARFAVVSWVDEMFLNKAPDLGGDFSSEWKEAPLESEIYETRIAGVAFFERLEAISPTQKDLQEIYYLCLRLGFRGHYYDQETALDGFCHNLAENLLPPIPDLQDFERQKERVTPQPYTARPLERSLQAPPVLKSPPPEQPQRFPWAGVVLPLLAVALLLLLLWPKTTRLQIADVEAALRDFSCCQIAVASLQNGRVQLTGRVESQMQRQQVEQVIQDLTGVTEVKSAFIEIPRPFCEVLDLLEPFQRRGKELGVDLHIQPQQGCDETYTHKQELIFDVIARKPLQHVYVDYYAADKKSVAHILPNEKQVENNLKGKNSETLGGPGSRARWEVLPDFGKELVTVIASPEPLFTKPRLVPEGVSSYLSVLRRALPEDASSSEITANYCFISTAPDAKKSAAE